MIRFSEDETIQYTANYALQDGSAFPFDNYKIELAVADENGTQVALLSGSSRVVIDAGTGNVLFKIGTLTPGRYRIAERVTDLTSGDSVIPFEDTLIVTEGPY